MIAIAVIDQLSHVNGSVASWSALGFGGKKSSVIIRLSLSLVSYDWTHSRIWDEGSRNCRLLLIIVVQIFVWALFFDWCNIEINRNAQTLFYSSNFCLGLVRHAGLPCQASVLLLVPGKESRSFVPLKPGREMSNWVNCSLSFYIKWKKMWKREKKRKSFMWKRTHIQMFAKAAEKKLWMQEVCHKWGAIVHAKIANITTVSLLLCNFPQSHLINTIFTIFESIWKQSKWSRIPMLPFGCSAEESSPSRSSESSSAPRLLLWSSFTLACAKCVLLRSAAIAEGLLDISFSLAQAVIFWPVSVFRSRIGLSLEHQVFTCAFLQTYSSVPA